MSIKRAPPATPVGHLAAAIDELSFFDTFSCRSGRHCRTCRSRTTGRPFRTAVAAHFHLPSAEFPCPHARPWGLTDSPALLSRATYRRAEAAPAERGPAVPAAEAQHRFAICKACEHSRDNGFACNLCHGCCFGKFRGNLADHCPAGKW